MTGRRQQQPNAADLGNRGRLSCGLAIRNRSWTPVPEPLGNSCKRVTNCSDRQRCSSIGPPSSRPVRTPTSKLAPQRWTRTSNPPVDRRNKQRSPLPWFGGRCRTLHPRSNTNRGFRSFAFAGFAAACRPLLHGKARKSNVAASPAANQSIASRVNFGPSPDEHSGRRDCLHGARYLTTVISPCCQG